MTAMARGTWQTAGITTIVIALVIARIALGISDMPPPKTTTTPEPGDTQAVIIELTKGPAARHSGWAAAAAQRARMRQRLVALDHQHHAARGVAARAESAIIRHEYRVVLNGFAAHLLPETIAALRADPGVLRVTPDVEVQALLDVSVPHIRAPQFWSDFGYRGAGTTIAIIDTGVDYTHPDLGGCFGPGCKVVGGYDFINSDNDPADDHGHGTHVASIAAGNGTLLGVAPDASILAYKVLDQFGSGSFSTVIAGIERAADPNNDGDPSDHATVMNLSLGGSGDENDPVSTAIDNATAAGVLAAIAAGNSGPSYFTIGSPGTARTALTVGAVDESDMIAGFSSRGPTSIDYLIKPEISAPGVDICAAREGSAFPDRTCIDADHVSLSGTSMAAPHVAGAAALLRGLRPSLTPAQAKALLQASAVALPFDVVTAGSGRLDVRAAADVETLLTPAPLNLGVDDTDDTQWVRSATVTVDNLGSGSKTYTLSMSGLPSGVTAVFTPNPVTVDAHAGVAVTVELTVDNTLAPSSVDAPYLHSASLLATSATDQQAIRVGFAKLTCPYYELGDTLPVSVTGSTRFLRNRTQGTCGGAGAPEATYRWTAPFTGTFTIDTLASDSSSTTYDTVLYVRSDACTGSEVACNDDAGLSRQSEVRVSLAAGQSVIIVVDGYSNAAGNYQLHINDASISTPTPTPRPTPTPMPTIPCSPNDLGSALPVSVSGSTTGAANILKGATCGGGGNSAPEVAYGWTAPDAGLYTIDTFGSELNTVLYVRDTSCSGEELACSDDVGFTLQSQVTLSLDENQHIVVVVDGYGSDSGSFTLHINAGAVETPELCGNGVLDAGEECDDGNRDEKDTCKNDCTPNVCGDGVLSRPIVPYPFTAIPFHYIDISGVATPLPLADDQVSGAIPLGFDFDYFGHQFSSVYVSSNGFIGFNPGMGHGCCAGQPLPSPGGPGDNLIAAFWTDLRPGSDGGYSFARVGNVFVIEANHVPLYGVTGGTASWQYQLYAGTNRIEIHYLDAQPSGHIVTAGIENGDGTIGHQHSIGERHLLEEAVAYVPNSSEQCDDGNLVDGDGCDSNCTLTACGNGILTPPELCDDGNQLDGDGCDSNCTPTACGNGVVSGTEQCDDGNTVSGDGCSATCRLESPARACQKAIAGAGASFFNSRLTALRACRERINAGTLAIDPSACASEQRTATVIAAAAARLRSTVARSCTNSAVSALKACAGTVDGLATSAGTGCLPATHGAAGDAVQAQWGRTLLPGETSARQCQNALAKAGRRYASSLSAAYRRCRTSINSGRLLLRPGDCAGERRTAAAITGAGRRARASVAGKCTDALLAAIAPCASSVDGIITPAGDAGCLVTAGRAAVDAMLVAEYGSPSH